MAQTGSDSQFGPETPVKRRPALMMPICGSYIHFQISAPGYKTCTTHVFVDGDEYLDSDAVFGVKSSLIQGFEHHDAGTDTPDGRDIGGGEWWEMHYDFVLAGEDAK